jgi:hypothetical protein
MSMFKCIVIGKSIQTLTHLKARVMNTYRDYDTDFEYCKYESSC